MNVSTSDEELLRGNFSTPTLDPSWDVFFKKFRTGKMGVEELLGLKTEALSSEFPILPPTVVLSCLICVSGVGVLLNVILFINLCRRKINGFFSLLLQLALSDILMLTIVAVPEMWSQNEGNWKLGPEVCVMYMGFEVFVGTANVYFLIAICFHAISIANVTLQNLERKESEDELLEDATETRSSRHSLVSRNESSAPSKAEIEYKNKLSSIPVLIPVVLVWILSLSLSIPEFVLSTTIDSRKGTTICTFVDDHHLSSMRILLSVFKLLIPLFVLFVISTAIVYKMYKISTNGEAQMMRDSLEVLKVALFLCCIYLILSVPRSALSIVDMLGHNKSQGEKSEMLNQFKTPPLNNSLAPGIVLFVLSFCHFVASVAKPVIYICLIKNPKYKVLSGFIKYHKQNQEEML